jgi:hypothetical protein
VSGVRAGLLFWFIVACTLGFVRYYVSERLEKRPSPNPKCRPRDFVAVVRTCGEQMFDETTKTAEVQRGR